MLLQFSKIMSKLDGSRGLLSQFAKIFSKADALSALPWKPTVAVIASGFALATVVSVVMGQWILDDATGVKKSDEVPATAVLGTDASITRSAVKEIIKRNIFNSEGKTAEDLASEEPGGKKIASDVAVKTSLPIKVLGIIYGGDSTSGIAVVEDTSKQVVNSFMYQDVIGKSAVILEILEDRIIFDNDGSKEYAELFREETKKSRRKKGGESSPVVKASNGDLSPLATTPPPTAYKEEGFERDKNKIVMSQDFKQKLLTGDFAKVLQDAKAEPNIVEGELRGFKLTRIRQDSIYEKAGFQNDDVITEINGTALTDTAQAIKLLNALKTETEIEVRLDRGGNFMNMAVEIR